MIIIRKIIRKLISSNILNRKLKNTKYRLVKKNNLPIIFLVGPPRSGSSFFYNLIIKNFELDYVSNLEYFFYKYPFFSIKVGNISKKLIKSSLNFKSSFGLSGGLNSPSENGLFWEDYCGIRDNQTRINSKKLNINTIRYIFYYRKKYINKVLINKFSAIIFFHKYLNKIFNQKIFIGIKRDPYQTALSILEARKKINGSINIPWSFLPEKTLDFSNPIDQVCYQVCSYLKKMNNLEKKNKIIIFQYEKILQNPQKVIMELNEEFRNYGILKKKNVNNSGITKTTHYVPNEVRISMKNMLNKFNLKEHF